MKWRTYPVYRDSGVEWLREIPERWDIVRFKYALWLQRGHDLPTAEFCEGEYPVCGSNGCIGYHSLFTTRGPGVTVGRSGSVGEVNYIDTDYWAHNTALYVKEFRQVIPKYSYYLLKTLDVKYLGEGTAVGTLNRNYIHDLRIPVPTIAQQQSIAAFLDRETSRIDELIAKKQRQIDLLQEKRSALISYVVTKGLDPDVKMKDSGVEWLGEIPEHWKISRVKYVASVVGRIGFRGYTTDDQVDAEEGALTIGATQFNSTGQIDLSSPVYISWEKYYESPEIMVSYNDILVVQRGSTCGKIGFVDRELGPTTINPSVVLLKRIRIVPKYLYYYLSGSFTRSVFDSLLSETAIPMLSQFQIGNIPLCLPPAEEMEIAVEYIDVETARIDRLMERVNTSIHLLREYRTALISAAVTGKIDVREEVA